MRMCEACCRDYTWRFWTCPYCGYNNSPKSSHPRSLSFLMALEQRRLEEEQRERQLKEDSYD